MRRIHIGFGLMIIVALVAMQAAATQAAPLTQETAQEYTLGVVLPYTGDLGEYGKGFKEGIDLAVDQTNAQLAAAGRALKFKVVSQDTAGTPDGAAKAIQTVAQTSGAQVFVGPLTTGEVLGAKQYADQNKIVIIAPASTGMAGAIADDYIFRVVDPPDSFAGQAFEGIAVARGYKNVVILNVDDVFGNGLATLFTDRFKAAGGGTVSQVKYQKDAPNLSSELTKVSAEVAKLAASGKTAFLCACFLGDAQKLVKLAVVDANMGKVDWLGVENLYQKAILSNKDEASFLGSVHFTVVSISSSANPNTQPFIKAYKDKYNGKEPGPFTNAAYDAAIIGMQAMIFAGNKGEAVQKVLPWIADHYIGTQVQTYLDENGDQAIGSYSVYQVKDDGSDFAEIGSYDGSTGSVTLTK